MPEQLHPLEILRFKTQEKTKKQVCIGKIHGSVIFEQIGNNKYAIYQEMADGTWELTTKPHHEHYTPMPKTPLTHPTKALEYESPTQLFKDVRNYIHTHLDLPNPLGYDILASFVFASWIPELFDFTPYLGFYGREAVGKTRALETLNELCLRSWFTTGLTIATLFRLVEKFKPTLLLDESEFLTQQERKELISLINAGQRRGVTIPRMGGKDYTKVEYFNVYCPKVISGTEQLRKTTTSRMITFTMTRNVRDIPRRIDKKEGLRLRNQLLLWRFHKIAELKDRADFKEKISPTYQLTAREEYKELEPLSGRTYELFYPLYHSAPTNKQQILKFALNLERIKLEREKTTLARLVLEAILNRKHQAKSGILLLKQIRAYINRDRAPHEWLPSKTISRKCEQLGFQKTRTSNGVGFYILEETINRLMKDPRYSTSLAKWLDEGNNQKTSPFTPKNAKKKRNEANERSEPK